MILWHIFLAFFIPGILGYGGGPSSIPLIENEVVGRYHWMTVNQFTEVLALGNALPGPIATKMSGYIGYMQGGILGSIVATVATVGPSLFLMIVFLGVIYKYKDSPRVKKMTLYVKPTIAVLLGIMTYNFFMESVDTSGWIQTAAIALLSFLLMERLKVSPVIVIVAAIGYGALFMV
ncbi:MULTISPECIES: chromate transporter [Fictibacillus]|uniref:Transporter n=1 Tax=Fictibacillus enclensis TaxID=1017270 RepID=A0A0V8J7W0_9BACL|nr:MULTISPECIES: chromate transporter [Fictibacillus]KSU83271.1 transporter [Fictibacillus enclensis]RXZ02018.1 chromate transporter [Fictibacillus sp. S7]SCC12776.1 chromate transporter [Fictibacillus enclensis]